MKTLAAWNIQTNAFAKIVAKDLPKGVESLHFARMSEGVIDIPGDGHLQVSLPCSVTVGSAAYYMPFGSLALPAEHIFKKFEKKYDPNDFVAPIDVSKITMQPVDRDQFERALSDCMSTVSSEKTRYYLCGIAFNGALAVATDGHRMVSRPSGLAQSPSERALIVPTLTIKAFQLALKYAPADAPVTIGFSDGVAHFQAGDIHIRSRLIDGTYPDWRRVVPINRVQSSFGVEKQVAIEACKLAIQLHKANGQDGVALVVLGGGFIETKDKTRLAELRDCTATYSVTFNAKYVLDALQCIDSPYAYIRGADAGSPHMFTPREFDASIEAATVVMPTRV